MNPPVARLVDPLALLAGARHPDPFSVLGPHVTGTAVVIRAILPGAERVDVIAQGMAVPVAMERGHPAGVFEARLEGLREIPDYRLRVIHPGGHVVEIDDPFRFGRILTDFDLYLFGEGNHTRIYEKLGAHPMRIGSSAGVHFAVWAPNAQRVSVVGDFNNWDGRCHPMRSLGSSGVWEIFIPAAREGHHYKFELRTREGYIEIIEMGTVTNDHHSTLSAITHGTSGVPSSCPQLLQAWTAGGYWTTEANTDIGVPTGGLYGAESIINVGEGLIYAVNAEAIDGFISKKSKRSLR